MGTVKIKDLFKRKKEVKKKKKKGIEEKAQRIRRDKEGRRTWTTYVLETGADISQDLEDKDICRKKKTGDIILNYIWDIWKIF